MGHNLDVNKMVCNKEQAVNNPLARQWGTRAEERIKNLGEYVKKGNILWNKGKKELEDRKLIGGVGI